MPTRRRQGNALSATAETGGPIELSTGFGDQKDIADVSVGGDAINSRRQFLRVPGTFYPPRFLSRRPFQASPLTHALCLRGGACRLLIERSVSGTTRHTSAFVLARGRFRYLASRDGRTDVRGVIVNKVCYLSRRVA